MVVAKSPRPGLVKTRLTPALTPGTAASLAEAALADTLDAVLATRAARRVLVLDGPVGEWLPPGVDVVPQVPGGLDERLAGALRAATGPVLLVGMDTPQVTPMLLTVDWQGADAGVDAVFGPAADGGFWALGLRRPDPALVSGVPMSRPDTGRHQRDRLVSAGLRVVDLPVLRDVDTVDDIPAVAELAPGSRFAARWAEVQRAQVQRNVASSAAGS
jgi:hypothetical protein